jgi:hypothetical protein
MATLFYAHQIRAIDHSRLSPTPRGRLNDDDLLAVERAVKFTLGFALD